MRRTRRLALAIGSGLLATILVGGGALAAFQPPDASAALDDPGRPGRKLAEALQRLVEAGTITTAQRDAILAKVQELALKRPPKQDATALGDARRAAEAYLRLDETALAAQRKAGKSLADIAAAIDGKSRTGLVDAIAAAVGDKLSAEQIAKVVDAKPRVPALRPQVPKAKPAVPGTRTPALSPGKFIGDGLEAAGAYLGLTRGELRVQLRDGKSLAGIAAVTPGKSRQDLVDALTTDATRRIDDAQKAGRLTADQATSLRAKIAEAVGKLVDAKRTR